MEVTEMSLQGVSWVCWGSEGVKRGCGWTKQVVLPDKAKCR